MGMDRVTTQVGAIMEKRSLHLISQLTKVQNEEIMGT